MIKKPIPEPTAKQFHDLLDRAVTTVLPAASAPERKEQPESSFAPPKGETSDA